MEPADLLQLISSHLIYSIVDLIDLYPPFYPSIEIARETRYAR